MLGKILFAKGVPHTQMGGNKVLLVPFTMASKDNDYLHEPNYNLTTDELDTKKKIINKMMKALVMSGLSPNDILTINFSTMNITIKVGK
jgi:hypothetical protein